jgi:hypothetical protein
MLMCGDFFQDWMARGRRSFHGKMVRRADFFKGKISKVAKSRKSFQWRVARSIAF